MRNISYRDLEEHLHSWDIGEVMGLKTIPHYSTLCRAKDRLTETQMKSLFDKVLEVIEIESKSSWVFVCDSTGFKEDSASFYYTLH